MAKKILINEYEFFAFDGISHLAIVLYIKAIRPYMDYSTGITGWMRGISYQSLAEEAYVEPVAGRHISKCGKPTKSAIRNAVKELITIGLLTVIPAGKKLVFKLNKATLNSSVQNRSDTGTTQGSDTGTTRQEQAIATVSTLPTQQERQPKIQRSDTPQVSGCVYNTTTTTKDLTTDIPKKATATSGGGGDFVLIFEKRIGKQQQQAIRNALPPVDQTTAQSLLDELAGVMINQDVKNPVSYFVGIVKRFKAGDFVPTAGVSVLERRQRNEQERLEAKKRMIEHSKPKSQRTNNKKTAEGRAAMKAAINKRGQK